MTAPSTTPPPGDESTLAALGAHAHGAAGALVQLAADLLRLIALETRLAGLSLAGILFAAMAASFSVMALWLLLQALVAVGLTRLGADMLLVLLGLIGVNGLISVALLLFIRRLSGNLLFRATGRALFGHRREAPPA